MPVRQRKEIQEMPRFLKIGILIGIASAEIAAGAIFPENWGLAKRLGEPESLNLSDQALAEELGFEAGEKAVYQGPMGKFNAQTWRFKDPTSALVYYFAVHPEGLAKPPAPLSKAEPLALIAPNKLFLGHGNYIFQVDGWLPSTQDLKVLYESFNKLDQSSLPVLPGYLPLEGRTPGSERYIIGPTSLERYEGRIGSGTAAFSMGAEAVTANYGQTGTLSIFNYPTHDMARQRVEEFRKVAGSKVKRSGPLVAILLGSSNADAAERILAKVNYQAALTWNEPTQESVIRGAGNMMLSIFTLAGLLSALAVGTGIMFGLLRYARRRYSKTDLDDPLITLDLSK